MAATSELNLVMGTDYGSLSGFSYDGTYIWMLARSPIRNPRLFRFDPELKSFVRPNGSLGDYTNSYVEVNTGQSLLSGPPLSNGTNLCIVGMPAAPPNAVHIYDCATMSFVRGVADLYNSSISSNCRSGFEYGGLFYYPGWNGVPVLWAVSPSGTASVAYNSTIPAGVALGWARRRGNTVLLGGFGYQWVERVSLPSWTLQWVTDLGTGIQALDADYDAIRDEVWVSVGSGECVVLRGSDGALVNRLGTPTTYAGALIGPGGGADSIIDNGNGILVDGNTVWTGGGNNTTGWRMTRRLSDVATSPGTLLSLGRRSIAHWTFLPNHPVPQIVVGKTAYFAIGGPIGNYSWTSAYVGWMDSSLVTPNLTRVTPNSGGLGIALEFSDAVTASPPPTLDPAVNGLEVLSASTPDSTHIQLDIAIPNFIATELVSIVAADRSITLTFNKAVLLSTIGQLTDSYAITTSTPNAVIPTIASVEAIGNQVILHTSEQTTGAQYVVTVAPGSIYASN